MEAIKTFLHSARTKRVFRVILAAALAGAAFITTGDAAQSVFNSYAAAGGQAAGKRKPPIYCVDTPEKKV